MGSTSWPVPNADPNLDRLVDDIQYEQLFSTYLQDGVAGFSGDPDPVFGDGSGRTVKFRPYTRALVRGHGYRTDSAGVSVSVAANGASTLRTDLAVLRLDRTTWKVTEAVRTGTAGGPAPNPVQDLDATAAGSGIWEVPMAEIKVAPGATTITASDVKFVGPFLAPQPITCDYYSLPKAPRPGQMATCPDKGRSYICITPGRWHLLAENGPLTKLPPNGTIWTNDNLWAQRRNGYTYFQGLIYRSTAGSPTAVGQDVVVAVIPAPFRPNQSMYLEGTHLSVKARFYINGGTGALTFLGSSVTFDPGDYLTIHPVTYPSNDL